MRPATGGCLNLSSSFVYATNKHTYLLLGYGMPGSIVKYTQCTRSEQMVLRQIYAAKVNAAAAAAKVTELSASKVESEPKLQWTFT